MKYRSTRGGDAGINFKDVLFRGYASDGGMYLPESIPQVESSTLRSWVNLSYPDLACQVMSQFLDETDIPASNLQDIVHRSFATFNVPEVVPITKLDQGLVVVEMYHGRSWSFKDLAMSCVGNFFNYFLSKENKRIVLLIPTSGDTGSSAAEAMRGLSNIDIVILLPKGRITPIQEKQMTAVMDSNVHVFRVDGSSDDMDVVVKNLFDDQQFSTEHCLGSASSLNFCRILVQLVQFFYTYLQLCPKADQEVEFYLPTGGGGNITAGTIARKMGLPIRFVCAVNHNNSVARFIATGECDIGEVEATIAPAMDIQFPYNFERVWYLCSNKNHQAIKQVMVDVEKNHKVKISSEILKNLQEYVRVHCVEGEAEIVAAMKRCWKDNNYRVCPHTAIGLAAFYCYGHSVAKTLETPRAVLATASPIKFPEAAKLAGVPILTSDLVTQLLVAPTRYTDLEKGEDWEAAVRRAIEGISQSHSTQH